MKKIPLTPENRAGQKKIRKMIAAGLPLAALMSGLTGCNSELGRGGVTGDVPMTPPPQESDAAKKAPALIGEPLPPIRGEMPMQKIPENVHVVKKGDTLDSIARKYGTTPAALKKMNHLTDEQSGQLPIGQKIKYK